MTLLFKESLSRLERLSASVPEAVALLITGVSSAASFAIGYLVWPYLKELKQPFHDITVGGIAFADMNKSCDYLLTYMILASFFIIWLTLFFVTALRRSGNSIAIRPPEMPDAKVSDGRIILTGIAYIIGLAAVRRNAGYMELLFIAVPAIAMYVWSRRSGAQQGALPVATSQSAALLLLAPIIGFFSTIALFEFGQFCAPQFLAPYSGGFTWVPFVGSGAAFFVVFLLLYSNILSAEKCLRYLQTPLPLLFLTGFCRIIVRDGVTSTNVIPPTTRVFASLLVATAVIIAIRFARRSKGELLSKLSVVAVAAFLGYDTPQFFASDFLHSGETVLGWQQIFEKGQLPFADFSMVRGFIDSVPGALNRLFFDGTYATYPLCYSLHGMLGGGLVALFLCSILGPWWGGLVVLAAAAPPLFKYSIYLPVLLALVHPALLRRPLYWLFCWGGFSAFHCLFHATSGIALTLGTLPVAAWFLWQTITSGELKQEWQGHRMRISCVAVVFAVAAVALTPIFTAWVKYILEQGGVNTIAHGTPLGLRTVVPEWFRIQSIGVWETYRIAGWILACYLLWHLASRGVALYSSHDQKSRETLLVVTIAGICSSVAAVQYSMCRIDAKGISRPGSITLMLIGALLPVALIMYGRCRKSTSAGILAALFVGMASGPYYQSPVALVGKALEPVRIPQSAMAVSGDQLGIPKLGTAFIEPGILQLLLDFKAAADRFLQPGESYFDMTNHVALYYLFDKKVPAHYAGYANITSKKAQARVIAALNKSMPPLVWIAPAREFEFGKASLRTYRIYRALLEVGYTAWQSGDLWFMVRNDRYREVVGPLPPAGENAVLLSQIFGSMDINFLPTAWGRNLGNLEGLFKDQRTLLLEVAQLVPKKTVLLPDSGAYRAVSTIVWPALPPLSGMSTDFMTFTPQGGDSSIPIMINISWADAAGSFDETRSMFFKGYPGTPVLVPLGANPTWLLSSVISAIKIDLLAEPTANVSVTPPKLLHLAR